MIKGPSQTTLQTQENSFEWIYANVKKVVAQGFSYPNEQMKSEKAKLFWLVKLRWLAISIFFLLAAPGLIFGFLNRTTIPGYMGVLGILFLFNFLTQVFWSERNRPVTLMLICFQLAFDLFALFGILSLAGGFANPLIALFLLNAALGGLLIPTALAWPFLLLGHSLLGFLQFQFYLGSIDRGPYMLATFCIYQGLFFGFWLVMRSLGSYLESLASQRLQARVQAEKQDRLRAIGSLAAGFSHEFASPLNVAKIRLERVARKITPEVANDIQQAMSAILVCENVVKQMNSSQMDARDFRKKKVLISEFIADVVNSWKEDHLEANIELALVNVGEVSIPPLNFAQVILNLLDNAFEASPKRPIVIRLFNEGEYLVFEVNDQGPGFAKNILENLGEPFNTNKPSGTGLGLYVSQVFAESLGGELSIMNQQPGARVAISWPAMEAKF